MTVKELKDELEKHPGERKVVILDYDLPHREHYTNRVKVETLTLPSWSDDGEQYLFIH